MSNEYLTDTKLYNNDIKEEFISRFTELTQTAYKRIFYYSAPVEEMYDVDLYDFNLDQISDVLKSLNASTITSIKSAISVIKAYIDHNIHRKANNLNPLDIVDVGWMMKFIDTSKKLFFTHSEVWEEIIPRCVNAQDSVIIALLFEGANGLKVSEIRNLQHKDINFETSEVTLHDDKDDQVRTIKVTEQCLNLIKAAIKQEEYYKKNGDVSPNSRSKETADLIDTGFVIKPSKTQNVHMEQVNTHVIYGRLSTIGEFFNYPTFTYKNIQRSGMLWMAKQILERDGHFDTKEQYFEICERFGISKIKTGNDYAYNWFRVKEQINAELIEQVYGESSLS